jgi:hypothetical protein
MSAELTELKEIKQRVARMESRMVQLGDHVGANLRTKMRVDVHTDDHGTWVDVDAVDVSLSRIHTALREAGVHEGQIPINLNGVMIAMLYPHNVPQKGSE